MDRSCERSCTPKYRFKSKALAKNCMRRMHDRFKGWVMSLYHCPFCHGWHVGRRRPLSQQQHGEVN